MQKQIYPSMLSYKLNPILTLTDANLVIKRTYSLTSLTQLASLTC